jgi:hypothetical protein
VTITSPEYADLSRFLKGISFFVNRQFVNTRPGLIQKRSIEVFVNMATELAVINLSNKVIFPLLRAVTIKYINQFTINTCGISNINFLDCEIKSGAEVIIRHPVKQIRVF